MRLLTYKYPALLRTIVISLMIFSVSSLIGALGQNSLANQNGLTQNPEAKDLFNLGGTVFAGPNQIDIVDVTLYSIDSSGAHYLGTSTFDTLGYYYFLNLNPGYYSVIAEPSAFSNYTGQFVPTYYGDTMNWMGATPINLSPGSTFTSDIHLVPSLGCPQGNGSVSGSMTLAKDLLEETKDTVGGITLLLLDTAGRPLKYVKTDESGYFFLYSIGFGTYTLLPEYIGKTAEPYVFTLDPNNYYVHVQYTIFPNHIIAGMAGIENPESEIVSAVYPNPAGDIIYLDFLVKEGSRGTLSIIDLAGNHVIKNQDILIQQNSTIPVDINGLAAGTYIIRLQFDDGSLITRRFIKIP